MEEIQRAGSASVGKLRIVATWIVPLNVAPSREWESLFRQPLEYTRVCHPNRVRLDGSRLTFESDDEAVLDWLEHIDRWIASANDRLAARRGAVGEEPIAAGPLTGAYTPAPLATGLVS